ncbi:MAG TPA: PadR family transcriptional regulator [Devosia sp.]|nr:PadR family transcriptional regulator [Devosia sp.]
MNVATLCLAILHGGEATGYEIRKSSTEGEYAYFVEASFGSIYPALARLEADGLVTSRVEQQEGRPAKKVYAITTQGRETFHASLFDKLDKDIFRSEFLLFARFARQLPASLVRARIEERLAGLDAELEQIEQIRDEREGHPGDQWVTSYGYECLKVARDHLASHMQELIDLAQPDEANTVAAQ